MSSRRRSCLLSAAAVVLLVTIFGGWLVRRQMLWTSQIRNVELFKLYRAALDEYFEVHKVYPCALSEATANARWMDVRRNLDQWGYAVHYESRGASFVLVSFGRGGRPDGLDYWRLRELNDDSRVARDICFQWSADQVYSDRGFHRCCGK
jgi:hypothetical protein